MRKLFKITMLSAGLLVSALSHAAPGEYWEITTKMDMPGMPMAMPATTMKVCIPKGAERDPKYTADKSCVVSDVKTSGNKTSWSMRCDHDGQIMTGTGEMSGTPDNSQGKMHLVGSGKQAFEMNQTYANKRLGGSCDTEEQVNKMKAQICEPATTDIVQRIYMATTLMDEKTCPGKKQPFCDAVRAQAPQNARVYGAIVDSEKNAKTQIAKGCGIDMAAANQSLCLSLNKNNVAELSRFCPAEVKVFRENERRKACEGRSFTAREDLSKCLAGKSGSDANTALSNDDVTPAKAKAKTTANTPATAEAPEPAAKPNPTEALIDSAKKLKGLFGL